MEAISRTIVKALLVTVVVALGFAAHSMLRLPEWALGLALLPAAFAFFALSGEARPAWWKMLAFLLGLSFSLYGITLWVPADYQMIASVIFIWLLPDLFCRKPGGLPRPSLPS